MSALGLLSMSRRREPRLLAGAARIRNLRLGASERRAT